MKNNKNVSRGDKKGWLLKLSRANRTNLRITLINMYEDAYSDPDKRDLPKARLLPPQLDSAPSGAHLMGAGRYFLQCLNKSTKRRKIMKHPHLVKSKMAKFGNPPKDSHTPVKVRASKDNKRSLREQDRRIRGLKGEFFEEPED